jgi:tetratricopeptide (TPR) repeat protein
MDSLPQEDGWHLKTAQGWLDLGAPAEAARELEQIDPLWRRFPELLELRWKICAATQEWKACERIASQFTLLFPRRLAGWLLLAASLHRLGQTEEACELLLSLFDQFPDQPQIAYHLAVYHCRLRWFAEARRWLELALTIADSAEFNMAALEDPALKALWAQLGIF